MLYKDIMNNNIFFTNTLLHIIDSLTSNEVTYLDLKDTFEFYLFNPNLAFMQNEKAFKEINNKINKSNNKKLTIEFKNNKIDKILYLDLFFYNEIIDDSISNFKYIIKHKNKILLEKEFKINLKNIPNTELNLIYGNVLIDYTNYLKVVDDFRSDFVYVINHYLRNFYKEVLNKMYSFKKETDYYTTYELNNILKRYIKEIKNGLITPIDLIISLIPNFNFIEFKLSQSKKFKSLYSIEFNFLDNKYIYVLPGLLFKRKGNKVYGLGVNNENYMSAHIDKDMMELYLYINKLDEQQSKSNIFSSLFSTLNLFQMFFYQNKFFLIDEAFIDENNSIDSFIDDYISPFYTDIILNYNDNINVCSLFSEKDFKNFIESLEERYIVYVKRINHYLNRF